MRTSTPGVYLYVFINTTRRWFVWNTTVQQHPISDATGAVKQIQAFMTESGRL